MIAEDPRAEAWMDDAACRGLDPDLFFPPRGGAEDVKAAKRICDACPVQPDCLEYALVNREKFGIWGACSERERRRMRRARGIGNAGRSAQLVTAAS